MNATRPRGAGAGIRAGAPELPAPYIHPSADIATDARIGRGTRIWNRAQVREGAVVGEHCIVGKDAYIDAGVHIGNRVKIQNGALVYHGVTIEDGVFVGPGAILTNDRNPRAITQSGELASDEDWTLSPIVLRYGCSIGAGAIVVAGAEVGRWALVGAGAVVTRSVPEHALVAGNPARPLGWVCISGHRLVDAGGRPFPPEVEGPATCPSDGRHYRIVAGRCTAETT